MPALPNPKHERFAQEIAKGASGRDAYIAAGFKPGSPEAAEASASRLLSDVKVKARIAELTERAAARVEVSKAWVMERLMRNASMCLGEQPLVVPVKEGEEPVPEYRRDPAAANQALQLLGKELGMFVDRSVSATTTLEELLDSIGDGGAGSSGGKAGAA